MKTGEAMIWSAAFAAALRDVTRDYSRDMTEEQGIAAIAKACETADAVLVGARECRYKQGNKTLDEVLDHEPPHGSCKLDGLP